MRTALYARFSVGEETRHSAEDQLRLCRKRAAELGVVVVEALQDKGISGYSMANRPAVQRLMAMARAGEIDLVIAEHTDRLSRSGDGWDIHDDLKALGVGYHTVQQGWVTAQDVALSSLVSVINLQQATDRTRRGLAGVVLSGRSASPVQFGYQLVLAYDGKGERIRGLREVNPAEAPVVVRILTDYAAGLSPLTIASQLNAEGVPGPKGRPWNASTIHGDHSRGTGILRNEIYRGVRVWGTNGSVKDRRTGRRKALPGKPGGEVLREDAPELRIVSDELWERVQHRLKAMASGPLNPARRRPVTLLGGLIKCACCGGAMTHSGTDDRMRCARRAQRGPAGCPNVRQARYAFIEARVLASIQANLLHPDVVETFVTEYQQTLAAERRTARQGMAAARTELAEVKRRTARLVQQVEEGMPWAAVAERHGQLSHRQGELERLLAAAEGGAEVIDLLPAGASLYRRIVEDLVAALAEPEAGMPRPEAARDAIRQLVTEVLFHPGPAKGQWDLTFTAQLAPVLGVESIAPIRLTA